MKGTNVFKILLDIAMLVLYSLLMFGYKISPIFHEVVGIGISALFILHIVLNQKMMMGLWKAVQRKNVSKEKIFTFISDIVLVIGMPIVIATGVMISRELFVTDYSFAINQIHKVSSYICLFSMLFHLALHFKYLGVVIQQTMKGINDKSVKQGIGSFFAGSLAMVILYMAIVSYRSNSDAIQIQSALEVKKNDSDTSDNISKTYAAIESKKEETTKTDAPKAEVDKNTSSEVKVDSKSEMATTVKAETTQTPTTAVKTDTKTEPATAIKTETITKTDEKKSETITSNTQSQVAVPTLDEFLSKLFCTACPKHCPLTNPRCAKGYQEIERQKIVYNKQYPSAQQ